MRQSAPTATRRNAGTLNPCYGKKEVHFEAALNGVWLVLGVCALASTIRAAFRHRGGSAWLHVVGVGLIVAALFPYISATDDVLRIENLTSQHDHRYPAKHSRIDDLMRLYETMDTPLVCRTTQVAVTLLFVTLIFTPVLRAIERIAPLQAGRSPPMTAA